MAINLPRWISRLIEPPPDRFVPYAGHVGDKGDVVMLMDKSLMAMLHLHGTAFELASNAERNARMERINTLMRSVSDTAITLCFHLVRHPDTSVGPQIMASQGFVHRLMKNYSATMFKPGSVFKNDWYISIVVHPSSEGAKGGIDALKIIPKTIKDMIFGAKAPVLSASKPAMRRLADVVKIVTSTLSDYNPTRLGVTEIDTDTPGLTMPISEIGTALHLIRTAVFEPIPHTVGPLGAAIYREPVVVRPLSFDTNKYGTHRHGAILSFLNYPARPRVGMFNALLSTPYPLVMTNTFRFRNAGLVLGTLGTIRRQMSNAGDPAEDIKKDLGETMNAIASMKTASGLNHFSLAVYAADLPSLDMNIADSSKLLQQVGGAAPTREMNLWYNGALESVYWLQMPGSRLFKPRPGKITSRDFACMASLDNFPVGEAEGYWGKSVVRLKSNGLTTYDLITHDEDVGHALVIGGNGRGKTVLIDLICSALEPAMGANGIRLIIDKDHANKLAIDANGGVYGTLRRNVASGLAPLKAFADTPRTRAFLHGLYTWMIMRDGRRQLTNDEDGRLQRGIARQLQMPPHKRSMGGIREMLGYADREHGAGARFERWCSGGSMGWLADNDEHVITLGAGLYGFDFTELIPKKGQHDDGACHVAAAIITHQLSELMDGRRIAAFFDECRFYLKPLKQMIEDYTLTGRKKELMCWLVGQQPEHFTDTDMGMSLVQQCRTKFIFADLNLNEDNLRKINISEAGIRKLRGDMTMGHGRRFLLWRNRDPVIIDFDLSGMPELPILSGRPRTINMMEKVRADIGGPPEAVLEEFYARYAQERKAA
jgi:type IV secretion system protein VirB4